MYSRELAKQRQVLWDNCRGGSAKGWTISIDLFPVDFKNIQKVKGPRLRILRKDEIEPAIDLANMKEDDWEDIG